MDYYIYKLIDPRTGKPFYIGKGKGNRLHQHEKPYGVILQPSRVA